MMEDYVWLTIGIIVLIAGICSFFKPEGLITKDMPKKHKIFHIDMKKYIKFRASIMVILGILLIIGTLMKILGVS